LKCRICKKSISKNPDACSRCNGFNWITRYFNKLEHEAYKQSMGAFYVPSFKHKREVLSGGWIVKIQAERKTLEGSCWYELNHSAYRVADKRHNIVVWFGAASIKSAKVPISIEKGKCSLCSAPLKRLDYSGSWLPHDGEISDLFNENDLILPIDEGSGIVWCPSIGDFGDFG